MIFLNESLRNGNVVTPSYQMIGSKVYDTVTGEDLTEELSENELQDFENVVEHARGRLRASDDLLSLDLLRFYEPSVLAEWGPHDYQYLSQLPHLKNHPNRSESLIERLGVETTIDLYETDAPELPENLDENLEKTNEEAEFLKE